GLNSKDCMADFAQRFGAALGLPAPLGAPDDEGLPHALKPPAIATAAAATRKRRIEPTNHRSRPAEGRRISLHGTQATTIPTRRRGCLLRCLSRPVGGP